MATAYLLDRSAEGRIVVAGPDRVAFLQRILTQDLDPLSAGKGTESFLLTPKGKYIAFMTLYDRGDHLLVKCPGELREEMAKKLSMYTLGTEADVQDATEVLSLLTIFGPGARDVLQAAGATGLPDDLHASAMVPLGGYEVTACRTDDTGEMGWDLHFPGSIREAVEGALTSAGAEAMDAATAERIRIEAGVPRHGAEMTENLLPPELAAYVPRSISYSKGCYVGQETIARIKTYGHVNRELRGLRVSGDAAPAPGTRLFAEEKKVGVVTSSCHSETAGGPIALAFVKRSHYEPGTELTLEIDGQASPATVVPAGGPWK